MSNSDKRCIIFIITLFIGMPIFIVPMALSYINLGSQFKIEMLPYFIVSFIGLIIMIIGILILPRKNESPTSTTINEK